MPVSAPCLRCWPGRGGGAGEISRLFVDSAVLAYNISQAEDKKRMSTQPDPLGERVIITGRAYVRLIEAADVLLDHRPAWTERVLLQLVRANDSCLLFFATMIFAGRSRRYIMTISNLIRLSSLGVCHERKQ